MGCIATGDYRECGKDHVSSPYVLIDNYALEAVVMNEVLTPTRNKNVFFTDRDGTIKVKEVVVFVVVSPLFGLVLTTVSTKMKDACIRAEDMFDEEWVQLSDKGFRVFKLFAGGYDRTDQSLISVADWTDLEPAYSPLDRGAA